MSEIFKKVNISGRFDVSNSLPIFVIAGPCVMESEDHVMFMAEELKKITERLKIHFVFKSSFDKANRTSIRSARGVSIDVGCKIFEKVKKTFDVPTITDVHETYQIDIVKDIVDVLQIPAFLSRQTDLLVAAGKSGKIINVKKGQFMAPDDMKNVAEKISSTGNEKILLCERGACFGYNRLVNDMTALPIMEATGYPVVFDATHSVQTPGGNGTCSGGHREFVETVARAATAVGVAGLFFEVHDNPDQAPCDGPNMVYLSKFEQLLSNLQKIDSLIKNL